MEKGERPSDAYRRAPETVDTGGANWNHFQGMTLSRRKEYS
jgi:hypothetical protein